MHIDEIEKIFDSDFWEPELQFYYDLKSRWNIK